MHSACRSSRRQWASAAQRVRQDRLATSGQRCSPKPHALVGLPYGSLCAPACGIPTVRQHSVLHCCEQGEARWSQRLVMQMIMIRQITPAYVPLRPRISPAAHRQERQDLPAALGGIQCSICGILVTPGAERMYGNRFATTFAPRDADFGMHCSGELRRGRSFSMSA